MATSVTSVPNFYPEVPVVPYMKTSIDMPTVVSFAETIVATYGLEVIRTTYCIFRNESGNGNFGVNNNYSGIQADNSKWNGLTGVTGTCVRVDGNGDTRRFVCFDDNHGYKISFEFTAQKVKARNMFIGAPGVTTPDELVDAYFHKWVANPPEFTQENRDNFKSLYHSALKNIS